MDEGEKERNRTSRVKELEAMVRKLETENQQLLTKVRPNESSARARGGTVPGDREEPVEGDVISLSDVEEGGEDDWLFVSPAKPPTPVQKKVTPAQWLSEGHSSMKDMDLPSLDDVRQSLSFHMTEAENLSMATSGASSLPLRARQPLSNRTARRYLDQVKLRRHSPTNPQPEQPLVRPSEEDMETEEDDVPAVEDDVPIVKWRPQANAEEDVPVIKWRPQAAASVGNDRIPIVKWKPSQPETPPMDTGRNVPIGRNGLSASEDVPVVKWRTPMPENIDEDVPVVRWNSQSSSSPRNRSPARGKPRNVPVRAIIPPGRRLKVSQEAENFEGQRGGHRDAVVLNGEMEPEQIPVGLEPSGDGLQPPQRVSRFAAHYSSPTSSRSQRQNGSSPSHSPSLGRQHSPGGRLPKPVRNVSPVHSSSNLRSRSPSPSVRYSSQTAAVMRSRSPSPSLIYAGQTGQSTSPRLQHPPGSQILPLKTPSPSGSPLMSRKKLPSPSGPVLNHHTSPTVNTNTGRHPSGLPHPPPSNGKSRSLGGRAPQQSYGRPHADLEASSSPKNAQSSLRAGGGRRGLTPPGQGGRQKRMLPTPPSQGGSPLRPPSNKKTSQRLQQFQPRPQPPSEEDDDSWLEGCF